jgi:hypothetical protein
MRVGDGLHRVFRMDIQWVNTPLVTYCDGPDARVAREGSTTSRSAQAETPATIITKQIRQPIGIRIEGKS